MERQPEFGATRRMPARKPAHPVSGADCRRAQAPRDHRMRRGSRVPAGPGFSGAACRRCRLAGRNPLSKLHLADRCASFCGPRKEDRDRSGISTRIDLSLSSLARVSSTLQLGGHPVGERLARHRSSVPGRLPVPCGSGGGTLRPLQPRPGSPGLPFVRPLLSDSPLRLAPSR